jgi:TonB family protein
MGVSEPAVINLPAAAMPRLLVELPSRRHVFVGNLRDLLLRRREPPLELVSVPAPFWPDVFVKRNLPWYSFLESGAYHVIAMTLLIGFTHVLALRPRVEPKPVFDHSQVIYYRPSDYLPPLDTLQASDNRPRKADPEFSRQPIISVPREADNRSQTIVTPPQIQLKADVPLPNIVAWSDTVQKPRLAIPAAPLSPAAEINRLAPTLPNSVVAPPQDPVRAQQRRNLPGLQDSVAAPPSDVHSASPSLVAGLQPALVAPPQDIANSSTHRLGDMNIAPSEVIAPAPQLPVAAQRTMPGGRGAPALDSAQVAPPPPSVAASPGSGSPGRMIALSLHPAVNAPPDPPAGNRRGTFASGPEGHVGASGAPGSVSGSTASGSSSNGAHGAGASGGAFNSKSAANAPSGLYVGNAAKPGPVAGDPPASTTTPSVNPNLIASVRPPRVAAAHPMQPDNSANLSEAERTIFGNRRFYSVTLNMPNLNSAGGSWIVRFAELKHNLSNHDPHVQEEDLSQPMATRKVDPAYPMQLMRENVHGTVILYAVIHADGTVGNVRVLRGVDERLDRFAMQAVSQWKFEPATKKGAPVDVEATFQIPFRPSRLGTNF